MHDGNRLDALLARLRSQGRRITPQRVAIIKTLVESPDHPSVEKLHQRILPDFPTTSLATVYKTISLLKDEGEVLELGFGELGSRYDGRRPFPHPHMICTACGEIVDPDLPGLDAFVTLLAAQTGYQVANHRFDLFGLCPACRAKSAD
jgi:Fur family transcriptional regulator, peroxide stress response regulator